MPSTIGDFNRLLSEALPHIIWTAQPNGTVDFLNKRWSDYSGSEDVALWTTFIHPEDLPAVTDIWIRAVKLGEPYSSEFRLLRSSDQTYRWHICRGLPARNSAGAITKWLGTATDVHDQKELVEALRRARQEALESEQKLRFITNNIPAFVSYMDTDRRYRLVNDTYLKWFELPRTAIEGKTRKQLVEDDATYEKVMKPYEEKAIAGSTANFELKLDKPSGEYIILDTHYIPDVDPFSGEVRGIIGVGHDVTERKKVQERYRSLTEALPQLIWTATPAGKVNYANQRCLNYSGLSTQEKFGEGWATMVLPEDLPDVQTAWHLSLSTGAPFQHEYRLRRHDGVYRWFLGSALPVRNADNQIEYWIGTATDIEEQKRSSFETELAKEAAENANATKSAFLANMSHEIRTPLGVILGFTTLLQDSKLSNQDRDHYIDTINRNGQSLTRIIDDILDLAKVEAGRLEIEEISFSLFDLLSEVTDLFKEKARQKGVYVLLDIAENVPAAVSSDPTRLRQILLNIIGNAVKFTANGGVRIRVRAEEDSDHNFKIIISVKDSGPGLTEDQRTRLFKPFSQADNTTTRKFGGTGLGLVLSKRLSEALGGTITIDEHELGRGCVFTVSFLTTPSVAQKTKSINAVAHQPKSCHVSDEGLKDLKILLVEDSPDNQFLIKRMLTKNGALVALANDGSEGVESALNNDYDLILMDIQMPEMDGYQAAAHLHSKGYRKPIVALTAHAMTEEKEKTKSAGFAGHVTKPVDPRELVETVAYLTRH